MIFKRHELSYFLSMKSRLITAGDNLIKAYDILGGGEHGWGSAAWVLVTKEKKDLFRRHKHSLIAANCFPTIFERRFDSHHGGIRTIREVLNNECKQDLQAKIDEANGDETPLPAKLLKLLEIFPRSGLKTN